MPRQLKKPPYKVGSLFAGMGGFCLAFAKEGFEVAWANEKDNFAAQTYTSNFPATTLHHKPIQDLSVVSDDLIPVDVLTAGFPCQPFSVAGSKMGFDDDRGKTFFEIIRLIREFGSDRPKILLFENVPHLLTHDRGRSFNRIAQEIQASGYWFMPHQNTAILNTRLHTEIPQNRERLYMVALSWDYFDTPDYNFPDRATKYRNDFFHSDYAKLTFRVRKGDTLAVGHDREFTAEKAADPLRTVPSIISIQPNDESEATGMDIDTSGNKIVVRLSRPNYDAYGALCKDTSVVPMLHIAVHVPALITAIDEMRREATSGAIGEYKDRRWFLVISRRLRQIGIDPEDAETYKESSLRIAHEILGQPLGSALGRLKNMQDQDED